MGSNFFGEPNSSSGSSRKGKKSENKPKQPQRGLGVAQLEKIRLHSQMGTSNYLPNQEDMRLQAYSSIPSSSCFSYTSSSSPSYGFHGHQSIVMGMSELERGNIRYGDSQPSTIARWNPSNGMLETQQFPQPSTARHFLNQTEDTLQRRRSKDQKYTTGNNSQNSETSDTQELDLELRL